MCRVLPREQLRVLLCATTATYRNLAKRQVGRGDAVLEIGSSLGACTHILHHHATKVIGLDVSAVEVKKSSKNYPHCRFEHLDIYEEVPFLKQLCEELSAVG